MKEVKDYSDKYLWKRDSRQVLGIFREKVLKGTQLKHHQEEKVRDDKTSKKKPGHKGLVAFVRLQLCPE